MLWMGIAMFIVFCLGVSVGTVELDEVTKLRSLAQDEGWEWKDGGAWVNTKKKKGGKHGK